MVLWRTPLADPQSGSYLWSSVTLFNNSLYIGISSLGDCPLVQGALARIDLLDPSHPRIRYLVPDGQQGAGIWSTPAIDKDTNTVFVTTGTGSQDSAAGVWGGTLLAMDATTLDIKAHYFLPTNSLEGDIEWGSSPVLFHDADGVPMLAAAGKDGVLYTLRRDDLSLIWQLRIAVQCICPECGCGSLSTPAFDGVTLFSGAGVSNPELFDEGTVYAIDPSTGAIIWSRTTPGTIIAPVTVANGMVFAGTTKGLLVLDAGTGDFLWTDGNRSAMYSQPVVVDGTVYCTYVNGEAVAWRVPLNGVSQPPTDSQNVRTGASSASPRLPYRYSRPRR
jgi:outer membrane protein assembly factor BamB